MTTKKKFQHVRELVEKKIREPAREESNKKPEVKKKY